MHLGVGVHSGERKSSAGAKPIEVELKFKSLVLQQLHNRSDDRMNIKSGIDSPFMRLSRLAA